MRWRRRIARSKLWSCKFGVCPVPHRQTVDVASGLGIGTSPSALIGHGIQTTIVEIDPVVHQYATQYFNLPTNHTAVIQDAVTFVDRLHRTRQDGGKYDYIIHDVFTGGAEPLELFTKEFLEALSYLLAPDGVIAIVSQRCLHTLTAHLT